jgi:hypothetical protein
MLCWFRGLYGDYPRGFYPYFLNLAPDGPVLRKYMLFVERQRIPVREQLLSAKVRMPDSLKEARRIGSGGVYAAGGPLRQAGASIVSCATPLGILEFAVKRTDEALLLQYVEWMRQQRRE